MPDKKQAVENKQGRQSETKTLTMDKVGRRAKSMYKLEEYELNDEDKIKFYVEFPNRRINEMLKELQEDVQYANENGINGFDNDEFIMEYIFFLCIKYFTSLEKGFSKKLEDKILQMEYLVDTGYYGQIIDEVFMPSEIRKVLDTVAKVFSAGQFLEQVNNVAQEKIQDLEIRHQKYLEEIKALETNVDTLKH